MVITGTEGKLVVVGVFSTHAPLYLLQLLLETARGIVEALEDTGNRTDVVVFFYHTTFIVLFRLTIVLFGNGRY